MVRDLNKDEKGGSEHSQELERNAARFSFPASVHSGAQLLPS